MNNTFEKLTEKAVDLRNAVTIGSLAVFSTVAPDKAANLMVEYLFKDIK